MSFSKKARDQIWQSARPTYYKGLRSQFVMFCVLVICAAFIGSGCGDFFGRHGSFEFDDVTQTMAPNPHEEETGATDTSAAEVNADAAEVSGRAAEASEGKAKGTAHEELDMEDPTPLIRKLLAEAEEEAKGGGESAEELDDEAEGYGPILDVTPAQEMWALTAGQCLSRLKKAGVSFERPAFTTPGVDIPVILTGPLAGVEVGPRWPQGKKTKEVMDCRLALGMLSACRYASTLGVSKIHYYTAYRPIRKLPPKCQKGKQSPRCARLRKAYQQAKQNPSWHLKALAVDIRWFVLKNGEWLDVLEHYDRRDGTPPCAYTGKTDPARLLQDVVCTLHRNRVFNVILTPNANASHHNHFHFDITPEAKWYIIR